ncbi:MAG: sugar ABC transporter ATP-binding protein [Spirochaetaceae bacterium]|jgi:ribose transport system ATP-binding protein|nr:sugar ABC transporter ATP-binding protein [Spirochaetaceae bacterium]
MIGSKNTVPTASSPVIFAAEHIKKYFGPTHANDDVAITIHSGEIRGLIGENGSGKSTLISMIAGIAVPDTGSMIMNGIPYAPKTPLDAGKNRIGTVVQELGLVDGLPAGVNIFLGRTEQFEKLGVMDMKQLYAQASGLLEKWGFNDFPVRKMAGTLSIEEKKVVELIRALSINPDLLILDEITQVLSLNYRRILIAIINKMKAAGKSVLMVTHDVEEMVELCDSITIMRDGKVVAERQSDATTPDEVKRLMVGRELSGSYYRSDTTDQFEDSIVLAAEHLESGFFHDVSFNLHKREILGFCGLSDAGIHELAESLFGVRKIKSGTVRVAQRNAAIKTPLEAMKAKIGYVPKDRDKQALMIVDTIMNNVCLPAVELTKRFLGFLDPKVQREVSKKVIEKFDVKTIGVTQIMSGLSGGNRQKVNLGRWMIQDKEILFLDCPTRGVDVGVKSYIYTEMIKAKEQGLSIIVFSDELSELIGMCDTLVVMKSGQIKKTMRRSDGFTEEAIVEAML